MPEVKTISNEEVVETGCCPRFDSDPWDEKEVLWDGKLFLHGHVASLFHVPLNYGRVMTRLQQKIQEAGVVAQESQLTLTDETSLWGSDIYVAASDAVPGQKMTRITGSFLTKVFEGSFKDVGMWTERMHKFVQKRGKRVKKLYYWYTTCPKCAKAYGKNYVVLFAQVD